MSWLPDLTTWITATAIAASSMAWALIVFAISIRTRRIMVELMKGHLRIVFRPKRRRRTRQRSYALDLLLPSARSNDVHANLDDMMPIWIKAHGRRRARRIRRAEILRVVLGHYWSPVVDLIERVTKFVR